MKKATPEMIEVLTEMKKSGHNLERDKDGWWMTVSEGPAVLQNETLLDRMLAMEMIIKEPREKTFGTPYRIAAAGYRALRA